jgi:alpha-L-fucosidase
MLDGNLDTFWEAPEGSSTAQIVVTFPAAKAIDVISLQEPIASRGQRIEGVAVDTWNGSVWTQRATNTTVGHKRLIRLTTAITTDRVRIRITAARLNPSLAEVSVYKQAVTTAVPLISERSNTGTVSITHAANRPIRYTLDNSSPGLSSALYSTAIPMPLGGTVKAIAVGTDGFASLEASKTFPGLAPSGWTADADSQQSATAPSLSIDGSPDTTWNSLDLDQPHWLRVDMGQARWIGGFTYSPSCGRRRRNGGFLPL